MIRAIETEYGGYKFRSRLEARWAVFLDRVGIGWDYEPEGVRVDTPIGRINYLPDFWLDTGQWGEVKGYLDMKAMRRQCALAIGLGGCGKGSDMVILGDVPKEESALWPVQLHTHAGLWAVPWEPGAGCPLVNRPRVAINQDAHTAEMLTAGFPFGIPDWAVDALSHARQARFEWGETPKRPARR
jgi:hypothetical protein